jgi:hypothetical protein
MSVDTPQSSSSGREQSSLNIYLLRAPSCLLGTRLASFFAIFSVAMSVNRKELLLKTLRQVGLKPGVGLLVPVFALLAACGGGSTQSGETSPRLLAGGNSSDQLAAQAAATKTANHTTTADTVDQQVTLMYWTLLGREPDEGGAAFWKGLILERGVTIEQVTEEVKRSPEYIDLRGGPVRDALKWPFTATSIWNTPIGSNATYENAQLSATPDKGNQWATFPGADGDIIVLTPKEPLTDIFYSDAEWKQGKDRCDYDRNIRRYGLPLRVPMPTDLVVPDLSPSGSHMNNAASFLLPDGRTVIQTQPFARCSPGAPGTSWTALFRQYDLYTDDGAEGAHGGSGLSALGGTLRVGELRPGQRIGPQHALKVNVFAVEALFECREMKSPCYRWPATHADAYATRTGDGYGVRSNNRNKEMKIGALLAIPSSVDLRSLGLETEPGMQLAWTMQNYGVYIVDDGAAAGYQFSIEEGAGGSFREQFRKDWHFNFVQRLNTILKDEVSNKKDPAAAWGRDIQRLVTTLHVVTNNGPDSVGGGGTRRQWMAPPFRN